MTAKPTAVKAHVNTVTASDQAYTAIVDLILSHQLRPGERTSVIQLADRLTMGRTPIKEAITRLQAEGLLSVAGRSGTTVNSIDTETAKQIFAMRRNLETFAVSEAVKNVEDRDIKILRGLLSELSKSSVSSRNFAEDALRFVNANVKFHALVVGTAQNPILDRLYGQIQLQAQIVTYLFHRGVNPDSFRHRQDEHIAIVDALEERDGIKLRKLLAAHAETTERSVLDALSNVSGLKKTVQKSSSKNADRAEVEKKRPRQKPPIQSGSELALKSKRLQ